MENVMTVAIKCHALTLNLYRKNGLQSEMYRSIVSATVVKVEEHNDIWANGMKYGIRYK